MTFSKKIKHLALGLSRPSKRLIMVFADAGAFFSIALLVSWMLAPPSLMAPQYFTLACLAAGVGIASASISGAYNSVVRYIGLGFFHKSSISIIATAFVVASVAAVLQFELPVVVWGVLYWAFCVLYMSYGRVVSRSFLGPGKSKSQREKVIIYGAGNTGAQLAHYFQQTGLVSPVAFVDDDRSMWGKVVKDVRVYPSESLESMVAELCLSRVLLAMPSSSLSARKKIIKKISLFPVHVQTVPDFAEIMSGSAQINEIREIPIDDLLGRAQVPANPDLLQACIKGKTVLVTGAGGSIGTELCRQIIELGVDRLVLLDICEPSLYAIREELSRFLTDNGVEADLIPLLGSVCDYDRMHSVLHTYNVETIYHAAAYKHVPIVEQNIFEGIKNNAFGTYNLAAAACETGVETFVLISTDKAVRPTSVMGATKRVAELILQASQKRCPTTRFCMVRFGNVLESSGSVVPLFRDQIKRGGPITVTHREIVRYFMTIKEAAGLVIQAGSMSQGGDVFVLDMGEPVKIVDLATRMVSLAGLTIRDEENPDGDIEVQYSGLRPGEKLYEELLVGDNVSGTKHPRIMRAMESYMTFAALDEFLGGLQKSIHSRNCEEAWALLKKTVDDYKAEKIINDLVWREAAELPARDDAAGNISFPSFPKLGEKDYGSVELKPDLHGLN
jgi:FlaA1/EpsC-like NDP-sugar epimerase